MKRACSWSCLLSLFALFALLASGSACGSRDAAFDPRFAEGSQTNTQRVLERLTHSQPGAPGLILLAVTDSTPQQLLILDAARGLRARVAIEAESRPELLGDLVVTTAHGALQAFDARDGQARWSVQLTGCTRYLGAARDGDVVAVVCEAAPTPGALSASSLIAGFNAGDGHARWQHATPDAMGRPAASAGLLLVPWQRQGLAVLEAKNGEELARLRSRDDVIDWVRAEAGFALFGHRDAYLIGPRGYGGTRADAVVLGPRSEDLPGRPALVESAFASIPAKRSAFGRVALAFAPDRNGEQLALGDDRAYFVFYRYVFAFDHSGALRWCRSVEHDSIASHALAGGLAVVSDQGELIVLGAADGSELARKALGLPLASASLSGQLAVPAASTATPAPDLRHGLLEVALDIDQRLVPARAFAIEQLAKLPDPEVSADLLQIYARSTTPPELQQAVASALRTRRQGTEHLVDALLQRYDFIEQTRPAPLSVLVPALIDAKERRALPNLIARMLDHETPLAVLPAVVHAVVELGDQSVVEPLLSLLRLYRADSSFAQQPEALIEAARGVLLHGAERGRAQLIAAVQDGIVMPELGTSVAMLLAPSTATTAGTQVASASREPAAALPASLGPHELDAAFNAHKAELAPCLASAVASNPKLMQVRVALIVEADGSTHALHLAPSDAALSDCLYPRIASIRFPRFATGRTVATHVFDAQPVKETVATSASSAGEPFWAFAAAHPRPSAEPSEPWWRSKQPIVTLALPKPQLNVEAAKAAPTSPAPPGVPAAPASTTAASPTPTAPAAPAPQTAGANSAATMPSSVAAPPGAPTPAAPTAPASANPAPAPAATDAWWVPTTQPARPALPK